MDLLFLGISDSGDSLSLEKHRIWSDSPSCRICYDSKRIYGNGENGRGREMEMPVLCANSTSGTDAPLCRSDLSFECF